MGLSLPAWTLRAGPVVRRESIPLANLESWNTGIFGPGEATGRIVVVSPDTALFSASDRTSPFDEAAVVNKGSVVIRGDTAEVTYRASFLATLFLTIWFGGLLAFVVTVFVLSSPVPLLPIAVGVGLMGVVALILKYSARTQIRILRGIAAEAAMRLRGGWSA
jgi:hypothetical protein